MAYIKLGPKGKLFNSKKYNLYLQPGNAGILDEAYYEELAQFIITGYFIEIDKNEYENLQLNQSNNPPINYVPSGVNTIVVVEPVDAFAKNPPSEYGIGARYIIEKGTSELAWMGYVGYIAEWNGISWTLTKPTDNLIIPVKALGIAATYIGTYPSGYWYINENDLTNYIDEIIDETDDDIEDVLIISQPGKKTYKLVVDDSGEEPVLKVEQITT